MRLRALIMGCPGSGKGTQTLKMKKNYPITSLSTGDMLRDHISRKTTLGLSAEKIIHSGGLVPDEIVMKLVESELCQMKEKDWFLDGFPRTLGQAHLLNTLLTHLKMPLNLIINLDVPQSLILKRIEDRWIHAPSGRVYNYGYNPPKIHGKDDVTGEPLSKREDDNVQVFEKRLIAYNASTSPLLEFYSQHPGFRNLQGKTSDEIYPLIEKELSKIFNKK